MYVWMGGCVRVDLPVVLLFFSLQEMVNKVEYNVVADLGKATENTRLPISR